MLIPGPTVTGRRTAALNSAVPTAQRTLAIAAVPSAPGTSIIAGFTITLAARDRPARVAGLGSTRAFAALPKDTYLTIPIS